MNWPANSSGNNPIERACDAFRRQVSLITAKQMGDGQKYYSTGDQEQTKEMQEDLSHNIQRITTNWMQTTQNRMLQAKIALDKNSGGLYPALDTKC